MRKTIINTMLICCISIIGLMSCAPKETVYESMPSAADWDKTYPVLMEKSGVKDGFEPEFFTLSYLFVQSPIPQPEHNDALLIAEMIDPLDKNKISKYTYTLKSHKMQQTEGISLTAGYGKGAEKVTTYEEFAGALFKRDFFPTCTEMEEIIKVAVEKSGLENPAVRGYTFETNAYPEGRITVSIGVGKNHIKKTDVYFDAKGKYISTK